MSIAMPDVNTEEETFIFLEDQFDNTDRCEWQDECENPTTWLVQCAECGSVEMICTQHCMELKEVMSRVDFDFTFNRTCGHNVRARDCPIVPKP